MSCMNVLCTRGFVFNKYNNNTRVANTAEYCNDDCFMLMTKNVTTWFYHAVQSIVAEKLDIVMDGDELARTSEIKMSGLIVTDTSCWEPHVNKVRAELSCTCFLLKKLSVYAPDSVLMSVYHAHIQSHVSYGQIFYGFASCADRVFILQKKAVRVVCEARPYRAHCKPLFVRSKITTFYCLLILEACCMVVQNPDIFTKNTAIHGYNTRASNKVTCR